ncbi:MAG: PAS domain S-box protein [Magnetococcales bacterium]|nr:PAS domain S-box protein [Magnetococcales bacterium]
MSGIKSDLLFKSVILLVMMVASGFLGIYWQHQSGGDLQTLLAGLGFSALCGIGALWLFVRLLKRLEGRLHSAHQRENLLGRMLDASVHPIVLFEIDSLAIRQVNQGAVRSLGFSREALLGMRLTDLLPDAEREGFRQRFHPVRNGTTEQVGFEVVVLRKERDSFPADCHVQRFAAESPALGVAMVQEISERRRLEAERSRFEHDLVVAHTELLDRENRLRLSVEHAFDGIITIDAKGLVEDINPAGESMFGFSREELVGRDVAEMIIPSEFRQAHRDALRRHAQHQGEMYHIRRKVAMPGLRADATVIDLELGLSAINLGGKRHYTAILHDVTERKQLLKSLRETLEVAESVHRMKSEFLANMSHEIRTPMNTIIGMTDLLLNTRLNPEEQRRDLEIIQQSSESLLELINGILDLSKIDAGMIALERVSFDLSGQLESACESLAIKAHRKDLELYCWIDDDVPPTLVGDPLRLRQVVSNLISNAIKFTDSGEVVLRVQRDRCVVLGSGQDPGKPEELVLRFSVIDTGEGIPEDKQAFIFERFTQLDGSSTRKHGGTGLGLAICKQLVALMDGDIGLESDAKQGSEFYFTACFGVTQRFVPGGAGQEADERRAVEGARESPLAGMRVLVADHHDTGRKIVGGILRAFGAETKEVGDHDTLNRALSASRLGGARPFDLVVLDHGLLQTECVNLLELDHYCAGHGKVLMLVPSNLPADDLTFLDWMRGTQSVRKPVWKFRFIKAVKLALGLDVTPPDTTPAVALESKSQISLELLLVEDQEASRKVAELILEQAGHTVTSVVTGQDALQRLRKGGLDLVLMDLQLPEMDGIETARRIRAAGPDAGFDPRIPILAVTAQALGDEEQKCHEAGMDGYLKKPYRACELLAAITKVIKRCQIFKSRPKPRSLNTVLKGVELDAETFERKGAQFLEQTPRYLEELSRTVAARNSAGIDKPLQGLGDVAREIGAWKVSIQGMRLRGGVEQNKWDAAGESLEKLGAVCQEAMEAVREKCDKGMESAQG